MLFRSQHQPSPIALPGPCPLLGPVPPPSPPPPICCTRPACRSWACPPHPPPSLAAHVQCVGHGRGSAGVHPRVIQTLRVQAQSLSMLLYIVKPAWGGEGQEAHAQPDAQRTPPHRQTDRCTYTDPPTHPTVSPPCCSELPAWRPPAAPGASAAAPPQLPGPPGRAPDGLGFRVSHIHTHTHTHALTGTHSTHIHTGIHKHTQAHTYAHARVHTQSHTHTHTHGCI